MSISIVRKSKCALAGLIGLGVLFWYDISYCLEKHHLEDAIHQFLNDKLPPSIDGLQFSVGSYPPSLLSYPDDSKITVEGEIPTQLPRRLPLRINVVDSRGKDFSAYVTISLSQTLEVVSSSRFIRQGEALTLENCQVALVDVLGHYRKLTKEISQVMNCRAKKNLNPGEAIDLSDIEPIPSVLRGNRLRIIAFTGPIKVSTEGIAREDGSPGQLIRVKNLASGKIVTGKLTENGDVEICLKP